MKKIFLIILIFMSVNMFCNEPPVVSNIIVEQRGDGSYLVDVYYDLFDADGDLMFVSVSASDDEGESWDYLITSVEGDIDYDVTSGNGKHIIWDFAEDHPGVINIPTKIRIVANDLNGGDFDWIFVAAGEYTWGQYDEILSIDYNYEIMPNEVTNAQYVAYLEEALAADDVWIVESYVYGFYEGDEYYEPGDYPFYSLGTTIFANYGRISYTGNSFIINVPAGFETGDFDDHPVVWISGMGAHAFAQYYGCRLPTEQEWEKAGRGLTGFMYPWGDAISGDRANFRDSGDQWDNGTSPVGFYNGQNYEGFQTTDSPSPYGCYDMCGNVYDWTRSWYLQSVEPYWVLRGGSLYNYGYTDDLASWFRSSSHPADSSFYFGFRCCRTTE